MVIEITLKNPANLIPYVNNAKLHSAEQVTLIASSIKEFGFNNPVLIDGDNGIIAGHGRTQAALKLGLSEVPTIDLSHLSEQQKKAYILADNRLGELGGGWDEELLKIELEDLGEFDIGFEDFEFEIEDETDYSHLFEPDNSEPKTEKHKITLEYSLEDYDLLIAKIKELGKTKENIFYECLLGDTAHL